MNSIISHENAKNLAAHIVENAGCTYDPARHEYAAATGYAVAVEGHEESAPLDLEQLPDMICEYGADGRHAAALMQPGAHLGAWIEETAAGLNVYLDISIKESDRERAIEMGRAMKQKAIYDLENGYSIYCGWMIAGTAA